MKDLEQKLKQELKRKFEKTFPPEYFTKISGQDIYERFKERWVETQYEKNIMVKIKEKE